MTERNMDHTHEKVNKGISDIDYLAELINSLNFNANSRFFVRFVLSASAKEIAFTSQKRTHCGSPSQ